MKWLLEHDVFGTDEAIFVKTLDRLGIEYVCVEFGKPYDDYIAELEGQDVIFHGSFQFAKLISATSKSIKAFCKLERFDCRYYYPRFGEFLLNSNYVMLPFGDLCRRKYWLDRHLSKDWSSHNLFIRPSSGYKLFPGIVVSEFWDLKLKLDPEELVVVAPYVKILNEWRLIVIGNEIVASSQYKQYGFVVRIANAPSRVLDYGKVALNLVKYNPDLAWTLDICETTEGLRVLEAGPFSCCGFYACDSEAIITRLMKYLQLEKLKLEILASGVRHGCCNQMEVKND